MARNLNVYNSQRLQTGQLAASVPVSNPAQSRPKDALNTPKAGVIGGKPGNAVAAPITGRLSNSFNSTTNANARLGSGFVIHYPVARVVPAMRGRMVGNSGHPVITKIGNTLQKSK